MNKRIVAVLAALVLVLGGAALYRYQRDAASRPAAGAHFGQALLPTLKASEIASIVMREPAATLTLAKKDKSWTIAEKNGFPADLDKVTELVVKAIEIKVVQSEPIGDKDRARLNLLDPVKGGPKAEGQATALTFKAGDGRILAELLLGKKYFKSEPAGDPAKATGDGRFVMLPQDTKQVYVVSEPFRLVRTAASEWLAKTGFGIERVKRLEVNLADGDGYRIERATDGPDWKLDRSGGGKLDNTRANSAVYSLNKVDIEDLAASDKPEDNGLDKPTLVKATTFDGLSYTLRIGKLDKERYPVRVEVEGTPQREFEERKDEKPEAKAARKKSFDEEMTQLAERVTREKTLKDFTLLVAKNRLGEVLKKKSELLQQKKTAEKTK